MTRIAMTLGIPTILAMYALAQLGVDAQASSKSPDCVAAHETWLLSTRRLPCVNGSLPKDGPTITAQKLNLQPRQWQNVPLLDFIGSAQKDIRPLWIVVHGNRMTHQDAVNYGALFERSVLGGYTGRAPRVLIWSWPSEQMKGLLDDARAKAARTPSESVYLAWLISQLPAETPITILGHSFGARIATGSLHLLGGGTLNRYTLPTSNVARAPARAVLTAAALHNNWLLPNAPHGRALNVCSSMLLLNNSCDKALKHYRALDCTKPEAAGYCGALIDAGRRAKVRQMDACSCLGKSHSAEPYLQIGSLLGPIRGMFIDYGAKTQPVGVAAATVETTSKSAERIDAAVQSENEAVDVETNTTLDLSVEEAAELLQLEAQTAS